MASRRCRPASYEVTLPGCFGPAFLADFAACGADHASATSTFLLTAREGQQLSDIAAMLQARGLMILDIRRVAPRLTRGSSDDSAGGDRAGSPLSGDDQVTRMHQARGRQRSHQVRHPDGGEESEEP